MRRIGSHSKFVSIVLVIAVITYSLVVSTDAYGFKVHGDKINCDNLFLEGAYDNAPVLHGKIQFDLSQVEPYSGKEYVVINNNKPYFLDEDLTSQSYEHYESLDELGRCTQAYACIGKEMLPSDLRENIGSIRPTGYHSIIYNTIEGGYLYNRCHLIGYQLTGQNANARNLITGTRYLNVVGMLQFEDMVTNYIKETGNHVLYRVTPIFSGDELVARGVLMEAESIEDNGEGICYNIYAYNVQPGIFIDYSTGDSFAINNRHK